MSSPLPPLLANNIQADLQKLLLTKNMAAVILQIGSHHLLLPLLLPLPLPLEILPQLLQDRPTLILGYDHRNLDGRRVPGQPVVVLLVQQDLVALQLDCLEHGL
jgi:hypothetical protein